LGWPDTASHEARLDLVLVSRPRVRGGGFAGQPGWTWPVWSCRRVNSATWRLGWLRARDCAMPTAGAAAASPVRARMILRIRVLSGASDGAANRRLGRTLASH